MRRGVEGRKSEVVFVGLLVANVEPLVPPPLDGHHQLDVEVCGGWIDMDSAAAYIVDYGTRCRLAFQFEEAFEETEMRLDPEPTLAEGDVASYMEDGIGGQLMELEPVKTKKAPEERMQGQREAANDER